MVVMTVPTCRKCKAAMSMKPMTYTWGNSGGGTEMTKVQEWVCGVCEGREVICPCCGTQVAKERINHAK